MLFARFLGVLLFVFAIFAITSQLLLAQQSDKPLYVASITSKFTNFPGVPQCMMGAAQEGDPSKGNAVLLLKAQTGCMVPWHWHTPSEQLMMVSGSAKTEMKDVKLTQLTEINKRSPMTYNKCGKENHVGRNGNLQKRAVRRDPGSDATY